MGKEIKIPEAWYEIKIKELGEIITGNTPSTSKQEFYGGKYLWASPSDLADIKFIDNTNSKLSKKGFDISRTIPKNGILVVCIGSTIGKIGMASQEMATNQQINSIICHKKYPEFVYYQLLRNNKLIKNMANQVAVPILNKTDFGTIRILLPVSYEEQAKIASILSGVDARRHRNIIALIILRIKLAIFLILFVWISVNACKNILVAVQVMDRPLCETVLRVLIGDCGLKHEICQPNYR